MFPNLEEYIEFCKKSGFFDNEETKKEIVNLLLVLANMQELSNVNNFFFF